MLKRINKLKNFGVFKNYRRSGDTPEFKKVNILYGWNYSGKTTISRFFHCLSERRIQSSFGDCSLECTDYEEHKYDESNLGSFNHEVRVFNSDFIQNNLKWNGQAFDPILLLGEESIAAEQEIEEKRKQIAKAQKLTSATRKVRQELEASIENGMTEKAKDIKKALELPNFNKSHLRHVFQDVEQDPDNFLLQNGKELKDLIAKATADDTEKLPKIEEYQAHIAIDDYIEEIKALLKVVPEFSNTIQYLLDNPGIAAWIEDGLALHDDKDTCEFCQNEISNERKNHLLSHFSADLKNHKQELEDLVTRIKGFHLEVKKFDSRDFYPSLADDFHLVYSILDERIKAYNKVLKDVITLTEKKRRNPFTPIEFSDNGSHSKELENALATFNALIAKNNQYTDDFEEKKSQAQKNIQRHYAAELMQELELSKKKEKMALYTGRESRFEDYIVALDSEIQTIEAKISNAQKGREKINEYIRSFLGRDEIKIDVIKDENNNDRFTILRADDTAYNLSEGEKTSIAFSFFLTKLLEIEDMNAAIVYIDDPISSLDSNHIFQVNALIKSFFFNKSNDNSPWELNCDQLFISTHNFEFFSLMRELPQKSKELDPKLDVIHSYYFVRRIDNDESTIEKLPKAIRQYTSEYHYLFGLIHGFQSNPDKADYPTLMNIPNAVRRFVELYTYSRIPGTRSSTVDQRADILWGVEKSKRILKVLHHFSHASSIERMSQNSDLLCDIEYAVKDLFDLLQEKDPLHLDQLKRSLD